MMKKQEHQLQIIWEYIESPIEIPDKTRKRLVVLLGELLSGYWEGNRETGKHVIWSNKHDK